MFPTIWAREKVSGVGRRYTPLAHSVRGDAVALRQPAC